ncbi:MAG: Ig-like domain-containing protein, partial [Mycobacterium sp.]
MPGEVAKAKHGGSRAGLVAAAALGLSLFAPQSVGVADAAPADDDTSPVSANSAPATTRADHSHRSGARPAQAGRQAAGERRSAGGPVGPGPAAGARPPAGSSALAKSGAPPKADAVAAAVSPNPIISFVLNSTPTQVPTQEAPALDGVVHGALNAGDDDGNALTYTVVRDPAHGQVAVDAGGNFTYTPADPGNLAATDTFDVTVSDADSGFHLHGLMGLLNLLTFGLIGTAGHSSTRTVTVSTTPGVDTTSYIVPLDPSVRVKSVLTVGDSPSSSNYPMVGVPDGMGLFDNNDGTFTLVMNHELSAGSGAVRAHGATGSFISRYVIDKSTLEVVDGADLIQKVFAWNAATQASDQSNSATAFNRFCSGDLAAPSAYSYNGVGSTARIFLTGEEGTPGRAVATVVTGTDAGNSYVLGGFDLSTNGSGLVGLGGWENLLANPLGQARTVVIGNNDGGTGIMARSLAVYVGTKKNSGTEADKAGLTNGTLKFVTVTGNPVEITDAATRTTAVTSGTAFTLSDSASTTFSRPEDGAWNPANPNQYYFVTTDRLDQVSDGAGAQVGRSRLWRLNFTDITNPDLGGTIDLLVDGDTVNGHKVNMLDNLTIDAAGLILIQEDTGGAAHNAKIWQYDTGTDALTLLAQHDPARFGDVGVPATAPFTINEESSGIIDA